MEKYLTTIGDYMDKWKSGDRDMITIVPLVTRIDSEIKAQREDAKKEIIKKIIDDLDEKDIIEIDKYIRDINWINN